MTLLEGLDVKKIVTAVTSWIFLDLSIRDIEGEKCFCGILLHVVGIDIAVASTSDKDKGRVEDEDYVLGEERRKSCSSYLVGIVASD